MPFTVLRSFLIGLLGMSPPPIAEGGVAWAPSTEMLADGLPNLLRFAGVAPNTFVLTAEVSTTTLLALLILPGGAMFSSSGWGDRASDPGDEGRETDDADEYSSSESIILQEQDGSIGQYSLFYSVKSIWVGRKSTRHVAVKTRTVLQQFTPS